MGKTVIVFDGFCILCNRYISWISKKDRNNQLYFTTFESNYIKNNHPHLKLENTVFVITNQNAILQKSRAITHCLLKIYSHPVIRFILNIIPTALSDIVYDLISKRRYLWFGKYEQCKPPSQIVRSRFLNKNKS